MRGEKRPRAKKRRASKISGKGLSPEELGIDQKGETLFNEEKRKSSGPKMRAQEERKMFGNN